MRTLNIAATFCVVAASSARAAHAEKIVAPLCVPKDADPSLYYARGAAVACWAKTGDCMQLGASEAERLVVSHPERSTPAAPQVKDSGKPGKQLLCVAATCKPIGKKLAAAIAATPATAATVDAKTVVLGGRALWDVGKDRAVVVKPPKGAAKTLVPTSIVVLDNALVATWLPCTGPCMEATVIDAAGAQRGDSYSGGTAIAIDGERIAIVPYQAKGTVSIIAAKSGKRIATIELAQKPVDASGAMLGANELGVLWNESGFSFSRITVTAGKIGIAATQRIAPCL